MEQQIMEQQTIEMKQEPIKVYVKVNENNEIIEVGSSVFIQNTKDWIKIDEGFGDKYTHAQCHYFDKPLMNEDGYYNYRFNYLLNKVFEN